MIRSYFASAVFASIAAVALLMPAPAQATWHREDWALAGGGVLAGGLIGYAIGRHDSAPRHRTTYYHRGHGSYYAGPAYGYGGPAYVRETRVWPFYRHTEIYSIDTRNPVTDPVSVSMAGPSHRGTGFDAYPANVIKPKDASEKTKSDDPKNITINVGDNNESVNIIVGGKEVSESEAELRTTIRAIQNYPEGHYNSAANRRRMLDVSVVEKSTPAPEEKKAEAPEAKTTE